MISGEQKNLVLQQMALEIEKARVDLLKLNKEDVQAYKGTDKSMHDRLIIDDKKLDGMIQSIKDVERKSDPCNLLRYSFRHVNGMKVENRSVPFGNVMIIYESRPDVTVEAAAIAFKAGNRIMLKGGKEARKSNLKLISCWHNALEHVKVSTDYIQYLDYSRSEIQDFLRSPYPKLDLIIPRGGEKLIQFVKEVAQCPVLVSGRGNNFLYVSQHADLHKAKKIIFNAKLSKISACNALDKVLIHQSVDASFENDLKKEFESRETEIVQATSKEIWEEEFLDYKIVIDRVQELSEAIEKINHYSGGHSASILTEDEKEAHFFMEQVDCAAVYHNASTRFTDGGQFGMGAELAISTEKMHHRGPLGLEQLVTNKWFVYGQGQIR